MARNHFTICEYCGAVDAATHKYHKNMCKTCGDLYERYRQAKRRGNHDTPVATGKEILARGDLASHAVKTTYHYKIKCDLKEEQPMTLATHKTCKQCGRYLPIAEFKKYPARGRGIYNTTQGHHTVCKACEKVGSHAYNAIKTNNVEMIEQLREHYEELQRRGFPPVLAPARQIMGVDTPANQYTRKRSSLSDTISDIMGAQKSSESELELHCRLVRCRGYDSFEAADAVHKRLADELRDTDEDLYEEINNLMDDWYFEDD